MGKVKTAFLYAGGITSAVLVGVPTMVYLGAKHLLWSTPARRTFTTIAGLGLLVANQCGDGIKKEYNKLTGIPAMQDSLENQAALTKSRERELTEIKYLSNKKADSLNYKLDLQGQTIVTQSSTIDELTTETQTQEKMYNQDIKTIMNQNNTQEKKIDSLYKKLEYMIENKEPISAQEKVYESIQLLK